MTTVSANAPSAPGIQRTELQQHDLSAPGREVVQNRVDISPEAPAFKHRLRLTAVHRVFKDEHTPGAASFLLVSVGGEQREATDAEASRGRPHGTLPFHGGAPGSRAPSNAVAAQER